MSTRTTAAHLALCAALIALVLGAFQGGFRMGRTWQGDLDTAVRLARLEERLAQLQRAAEAGAAAARPSLSGPAADKVYHIDIAGAPSLGPADAPVTIVEFSDFECPYCASAGPTLKRILSEYDGRVRLVFKHNPLPLHRNALLAHRAAVAAFRQGRFWEMHDLLFSAQDRLDRENLLAHARGLGLDLPAFEGQLASIESTQAVGADMSQAGELGIEGVPVFFINGRYLAGAQPFQTFRELIEKELHAEG